MLSTRTALPVLTAILLVLALYAAFAEGQRRGMDHVAMFGPEGEQRAMAVAISDLVYHLNLGYLGYTSVLNAIKGEWNAGTKPGYDPVLVERGKNREILNQSIQAGISLGPQKPGSLSDQSLITMVYEDLGYVDFDKIAFSVFGFRFEAMYYLFFMLVALSAFAFIISFPTNVLGHAIVIFTTLAFFLELHVDNFNIDMPTFVGMRHTSTLALIPLWYFIFAMRERIRFSLFNVFVALLQAALIVLSIKMRSSAAWTVLFLLGYAFVVALPQWLLKENTDRYWVGLFRGTAQWPLLLLLGCLAGHSVYMKSALHPVYATDDVIPSHPFWHTVYVALIVGSPELSTPEVAKLQQDGASPDALGFFGAMEYMRKTHFINSTVGDPIAPSSYLSPWTGTIKFGLHDAVLRRVVIEMTFTHPLGVLLHYVRAPFRVFTAMMSILTKAPGVPWIWLAFLSGIAIFAGLFTAAGLPHKGELIRLLGVAVAAVVVSSLPNVIVYAQPHTVADLLLGCLALVQFLTFAVAATAANLLLRGCGKEKTLPIPASCTRTPRREGPVLSPYSALSKKPSDPPVK